MSPIFSIIEVYDLLKLTNNCSSIKDFPLNSKNGAFGGLSKPFIFFKPGFIVILN